MTLDGIAVIGLSGRFPKAHDIGEFWRNLRDGRDCLDTIDDDELRAQAVPDTLLREPGYVRRAGVLDGIAEFDAEFFGFPPSVAASMDPQQRLFLQCGWHALEDAGHDPARHDGAVSVFAAGSFGTYFPYHVLSQHDPRDLYGSGPSAELMRLWTLNDGNFLATRLAHALDLRGPAITVQTACSSGLVAVHLAVQSLLCGESDLALAGAMTVKVPSRVGYLTDGESTVSADGYCRPFDVKANGTVFTSGGGVVVLKRLADAVSDGDHVRAVIRGSAINNDGSLKMGYTAPSVEMQAAVIAEALAVAEVDPATVGYVEAHGTGTALGDPVELSALRKAFGGAGDACAVGSVKSNIGHCEVAAGIAGLIKTVLCLEERALVPTAHFTEPNPELGVEDSPFFVPTELSSWDSTQPRRAGVSSLGVGGTNAHVVLEEAPARDERPPRARPQVLVLSARNPDSLGAATRTLADHLRRRPDIDLADAAFTLASGRRAFQHRRAVVATSTESAAVALDREQRSVLAADVGVVFLFGGHDECWPGMADALCRDEPTFAEEWNRCVSALGDEESAQARTFAVQYALARTLEAWGVHAVEHVGVGVGRHTIACLTGRLDLADVAPLLGESTVDDTAGFEEASSRPDRILLQVGPGDARLGRAVRTMPDGDASGSELEAFLGALAELWTSGVEIDWTRAQARRAPRRVPLPGYRFDRTGHWLESRYANSSGAPASPNTVAGGSAVEVLSALWGEELGVRDLGAHDNFFALGGDSVLATKVATRARAHGLRFGARDVLRHPTIAGLASAVASTSDGDTATAPVVARDEWLPLAPAQQGRLAAPEPFVPLVFAVDSEVRTEVIEEALAQVVAHHDALRLRMVERAGVWEQRVGEPEAPPLPVIPIEPATDPYTVLPEDSTGVLKCALLDGGTDRYLMVAVHAAATDQAAQRILAEDLATSCDRLRAGRPVELPAATSSWPAWVEYLAAGMPGVDLGEEREFWLDRLHRAPAGSGPRSDARLQHFRGTLDAASTAALRRRQRALRVGWREIVLSALGVALGETVVDVVGNTRKAGVDGFDLSRAVGCYDALYPVVLGPRPDAAALREALRAVPRQGLGYGVLRHLHGPSVPVLSRMPQADVLFVDDGMATATTRAPLRAVPAPSQSYGHALTVRCSRRGGELHLDWLYDPARDEVAELWDRTEAALVSLVAE